MSEELRNLLRSADIQRNSPQASTASTAGFGLSERSSARTSIGGTERSTSSVAGQRGSQDQLEELASLIGSIDVDLPQAVLPKRYSKGGGSMGQTSIGQDQPIGDDEGTTPPLASQLNDVSIHFPILFTF